MVPDSGGLPSDFSKGQEAWHRRCPGPENSEPAPRWLLCPFTHRPRGTASAQCALFSSGSQAAAEAPTREPPWSHVHMRWLGRHTSPPPQHLPLLPRILIKSFFTHLAAPLLTGLGRDSVPSSGSLLLWGKVVLNRRRYQAVYPSLPSLPASGQ